MEVKILTEHYGDNSFATLAGYQAKGGYSTLKKTLSQKKPSDVLQEVKDSGLRGRGGAGFPTGMKWSFLPDNSEPRYLLCNADEGEPGTFKDRWMMEKAPHQLIEGMILSAYACGAHKSYIYIRGEYYKETQIIKKAIEEAYENNFLGKNILGSSFSHEMDFYCGAGAYICGEETGMISSLEGKKGQPKLKPPFPALKGFLDKPTIVNNVETLAAVVPILEKGSQEYRKQGTEKSSGTKIFSVSGSVNRPGNYEVPLGYSLMDLIELAGGMLDGKKLKAVIPGGSSAPVLTYEESLQARMDYESLGGLGSMLGSGAVIIIDDTQCMVEILKVIIEFYEHESCGQCTPCREGTGWLKNIMRQIFLGSVNKNDVDLMLKIADNMQGKTICALSDAAAMPTISFIKKFRREFDYFVMRGRSMVISQ